MQNYDTYTPEINYGEEVSSTANNSDEIAKSTSKAKRRRRVTKPADKPAAKPEQKPKSQSLWRRICNWFAGPQFRILAGIFFGCLTVYLAVSFVSYFTTCIDDASKIASAPVGMAKNVANPGGEGGARLSELLINQGFGLGSLILIVWFGAITLKLLVGKPRFKTLDFSIKCIVALITVSLIIGLVTYNLHTQVNWGGYHGTYVNEFIINFIGNIDQFFAVGNSFQRFILSV